MDINIKLATIENYMKDTETQLQMDLQSDLSELRFRREAIEEKYEVLKQEATERCQREKGRIQSLCEQAKISIDGIRRRLYRKQRRLVQVNQDEEIQEPEEVLKNLENEIGKFEKTSLPYGIRQFFDNISLLFNSNYGQAEVDKINQLYQSMVRIQENDELGKKLNEERSQLEQAKLREIYAIDRTMSAIVDERVDDYIFALRKMIFAT